VELGDQHGYRNAQSTVLAPTGTIGFMMDCDTTGVEPDIALVKYKKLVGGGIMKIVNGTVPAALQKLGYTELEIKEVIDYIDENETIEGAPHLKDKDLPVFDCAFKPSRGVRSIHYMGHIKMMGAVQPFISGAISKTVNVPKAATVEEIEQAYIDAWRIGAKAVSIYRDGSKRTQPLNTSRDKQPAAADVVGLAQPHRHRLRTSDSRLHTSSRSPDTRATSLWGSTRTVNPASCPDDGQGRLDDLGFCRRVRAGHQLRAAVRRAAPGSRRQIQPRPLRAAGMTKNPDIRFAKSIVDYIFRWLAAKFLSPEAVTPPPPPRPPPAPPPPPPPPGGREQP